ncbi:hypothetical protein [Amycolatopsis sp. NPDC004169]|uniref:hypothetical protein n=1 Tax=Amycolatopsis sp. NPDC004169 TaxID=3154453 RepID=UPI0033AF122E
MTGFLDSVFANLPGPGRHLWRITQDLNEGFSCVWLVPDDLVQRGDADMLLDLLAARPDSIRVAKPERTGRVRAPGVVERPESGDCRESTPSWAQDRFGFLDEDALRSEPAVEPEEIRTTVVERLGIALEGQSAGDTVRDLALAESLRGQVIVVSGWDEPDPTDASTFLIQLTAMLKERGVPPELRPRVLFATRERDVSGPFLDRIDPVTTRVRWWWGATGRLDTAVVVAAARVHTDGRTSTGYAARVRECTVNEILTEVAGPDLSLAASLAASWDGEVANLAPLLQKLAYDFARQPEGVDLRHWQAAGAHRPPLKLRELWRLGVADVWDGHVRISPAVADTASVAAELDTLVWRGQNRALMPIIDEQRARLEVIVRSRASSASLLRLTTETRAKRRYAADPGRAQDPLELGAIYWLDNTGGVTLDRDDRVLLQHLRKTRNRLAHLQPLTDDAFTDLLAALPG